MTNSAITVRVLLFGPAATAVGRGEVFVELASEDNTVAAMRDRLVQEFKALQQYVESGRIAVNHRFAQDDDSISSQDEVALIAMVSGG